MIESLIRISCTLFFSILGLYTVRAQAFLVSNDTVELNPVVVTADFAPTDARQSVQHVQVLTKQQIEKSGALTLEEILQTQLNIRLNPDPILGSSVSMQGMQGENVKIMVDGIPVAGRLNGSVDPGQINLNAVQQIEIIQGAQSLMHGADASAGVINLITKKSQLTRWDGQANAQAEFPGINQVNGQIGFAPSKWLIQAGGGLSEFTPRKDSADQRSLVFNPKTQEFTNALIRFSPNDRIDIKLNGQLFHEEVINEGEIRRPQFKPYAFDDYYNTNRSQLSLQADGYRPNGGFWQYSSGYNQFNRKRNSYRLDFENDSLSFIPGEQDTSISKILLNRLIYSTPSSKKFSLLSGIDHTLEWASGGRILNEENGNKEVSNHQTGIFTSLKYKFFGDLIIQGGARWTYNNIYGQAFTPAACINYTISPLWQIRAAYANGFRAPALKELYFNFIDSNHFIVGNLDIDPEITNNFRVSVHYSQSSYSLRPSAQVYGFYNTVKNRITLFEYAPGEYHYTNLENWKTAGVGLQLSIQPLSWISVNLDGVLTGYFETLQTDTQTEQLNWSPDLGARVDISPAKYPFSFSVWWKMTGATPYFIQNDAEIQRFYTQSWNLLNITGEYKASKNIRLTAGVKNLLDVRRIRNSLQSGNHTSGESFQDIHWGRSIFIGVRFHFQSSN